ncbi:hypothetical protein STEG23_011329, partial [Scotinomys teguina]
MLEHWFHSSGNSIECNTAAQKQIRKANRTLSRGLHREHCDNQELINKLNMDY